jgi:hypothetical protein
MRGRALLLFLLLAPAARAGAQLAQVSPAPDRVAVTVYRDLGRGERRPDLRWLNGYALISETRTISLPAGESELRFEGVASGIIPQSAIISGLPDGLVERNRDAFLLSAGSLVDRNLGQRVTLRRTDRATGKVSEQEAVVRTGSDGGVVLQTADGFEALRCTGLAETLVFNRVPAGLSARPTLSVRARAKQAAQATVTLSYLAIGFDWQADYVATLSADGRFLRLQAWLTLASSDETSFEGASTQAVAGRVNREGANVPPVESPALRLSCWPQERTGDERQVAFDGNGPPPPPPPPPPAPAALQAAEIVVTGSRVMAERERLGDLQLYRIPVPVTVAANAQKQVGLIDRERVKVAAFYRFDFPASADGETAGQLVLRTANRTSEGLGLPLPAGNVVVFREGRERPLLLGEAPLDDRAVGEKVELRLSSSPGVRGRLVTAPEGGVHVLTLTNDRSEPVEAEVALMLEEGQRVSSPARLVREGGRTLWRTTVRANSSVQLRYRLR